MNPFQNNAYAREVQTAIDLGREAGVLALRYRGGDLQVELKDGDEPVTAADKAASELIVKGLETAFPDDVIISEEAADKPERMTAERVWFIDPIDGTKDFIRGEDGFCVMIGLAVNGRPIVGAIYQPTSERVFAAAPGAGAWLYAPGADPIVMKVTSETDLAAARLVASKSHRDATIDKVKSALGISNERNVGSIGLKLALIAVAECDLYVNPYPRCKTWDTAGPEALLNEAGGKLTDIHGEPLRYRDENSHHTRGLLASCGGVHDASVERLAPVFPRSEGL